MPKDRSNRTEIIPGMRVTPKEKQLIVLAKGKKSYSDYLVQKARNDVDLSIFKRILHDTSIETRLKVAIEMADVKNWDDGVYKGDASKFVPDIIDAIRSWVEKMDAL